MSAPPPRPSAIFGRAPFTPNPNQTPNPCMEYALLERGTSTSIRKYQCSPPPPPPSKDCDEEGAASLAGWHTRRAGCLRGSVEGARTGAGRAAGARPAGGKGRALACRLGGLPRALELRPHGGTGGAGPGQRTGERG